MSSTGPEIWPKVRRVGFGAVLDPGGGRNQLVGDYRGRDAVYGMFGKLMEVTGGTFRLEVHAILADDDHGVALVVATGSRNDRSVELKEAHVFHQLNGKVVEFWEATTDQYSADELLA